MKWSVYKRSDYWHLQLRVTFTIYIVCPALNQVDSLHGRTIRDPPSYSKLLQVFEGRRNDASHMAQCLSSVTQFAGGTGQPAKTWRTPGGPENVKCFWFFFGQAKVPQKNLGSECAAAILIDLLYN